MIAVRTCKRGERIVIVGTRSLTLRTNYHCDIMLHFLRSIYNSEILLFTVMSY